MIDRFNLTRDLHVLRLGEPAVALELEDVPAIVEQRVAMDVSVAVDQELLVAAKDLDNADS